VHSLARAVVSARRRLQEMGREPLQVLWKLPQKNKFAKTLNAELDHERDMIRVEEWIAPPSLAVLMHENVVLSVHHGGASEGDFPCPWLNIS
jgi:hypothetical protein